ncbi:MAG: sigma-70 factor domain-containing protein, partial [Patescibacteria group bacterium]|nr:sigma-70 factor domain-containing protein [Patescibacteria group bacterium]
MARINRKAAVAKNSKINGHAKQGNGDLSPLRDDVAGIPMAGVDRFETDLFDDHIEEDLVDEEESENGFGADDEPTGDEHTGDDEQIEDPVRIYLMQMGEIPLLSRQEEVQAARRIDAGRIRYRHAILANDYVLQAAIAMLESIRDGKLRLDRTIEVSVINVREKRRLLKVLGPNLETLKHLVS